MSPISALSVAAYAALIAGAVAQQNAWAQCGGIGWTGGTTCTAGYTCTAQSKVYSQCIPGADTAIKVTRTTSSTLAATDVKYWFSFGDSYSETGFNINSTKPAVGNPLGNPSYPGFTGCGYDSPNWVDLVTTKYNTSTLLTYNFAHSGATIDAKLVAPDVSTVKSMTDQVDIFLANKAVAPWTGSNALFSIFIGINDIDNTRNDSGDRGAFSDVLLGACFALVDKLYNAGARSFLFVNVPHVDRSPLMLTQSEADREVEKDIIDGFNSRLATKVTNYAASHYGVNTWVYSLADKLDTLLDSPTTYGFKDATSYADRDATVMWCNNYHISSAVHEYFAQDVAALLKGSFTRR